MSEKTFYRYIDSNGDVHFADVAGDIPVDHKGAIEKLTIHHAAQPAAAVAVAEGALESMHWPSFAWGLGVAAMVLLVMRIVAAGRIVFLACAAAIAASGFGAAGYLKKFKSALPSAVANAFPSAYDIQSTALSPSEARRILESLPKANTERVKDLDTVLRGEKH